MDLNDLRSVVTLVSFAAFIGICIWAWSRRRADDFAQAAALPLIEESSHE